MARDLVPARARVPAGSRQIEFALAFAPIGGAATPTIDALSRLFSRPLRAQ